MGLFNTKASMPSAMSGRKARSSSIFEPLENRQMFAVIGIHSIVENHVPIMFETKAELAINAEYAKTAHLTDINNDNVQTQLGKATSGIENVPGVTGAEMETFHDHGVIYYSAGTGAHLVYGNIGAEYTKLATQTDPVTGKRVQQLVGLPTHDEVITESWGDVIQTQCFKGGHVISSDVGTHAIYGAIDTKYKSLGGSSWGVPNDDEFERVDPTTYKPNGVFVQNFLRLSTTDPYANNYDEIVWCKAHGASVEPSSMYG
jgi:hypothetical protein